MVSLRAQLEQAVSKESDTSARWSAISSELEYQRYLHKRVDSGYLFYIVPFSMCWFSKISLTSICVAARRSKAHDQALEVKALSSEVGALSQELHTKEEVLHSLKAELQSAQAAAAEKEAQLAPAVKELETLRSALSEKETLLQVSLLFHSPSTLMAAAPSVTFCRIILGHRWEGFLVGDSQSQ